MNKVFIFANNFPEKPNREIRRELKRLLGNPILKELVSIDKEMSILIKKEMQDDYWQMYSFYKAEFERLSNIYNKHHFNNFFSVNANYFLNEYGIGGDGTMISPYKGTFSIIKTIQNFLNRWS